LAGGRFFEAGVVREGLRLVRIKRRAGGLFGEVVGQVWFVSAITNAAKVPGDASAIDFVESGGTAVVLMILPRLARLRPQKRSAGQFINADLKRIADSPSRRFRPVLGRAGSKIDYRGNGCRCHRLGMNSQNFPAIDRRCYQPIFAANPIRTAGPIIDWCVPLGFERVVITRGKEKVPLPIKRETRRCGNRFALSGNGE